jgi:predicted nucleic acid-binding protein
MPAVVLGTDVVSFLFKKDTRARLFLRHLRGQDRIISFITLAELDYWATLHKWGLKRRDALEHFLQEFAIHYADRDLCRLWAEVTDRARRNGKPIECADAWIAATALALGVPLVTHNPADYAGVEGLTVISETGP